MSESNDFAKRAQELEVENRQLKTALTNLEHSYDTTLDALGDALDLKEGLTEGHAKRVSAYTIALARKMGLSKDAINSIVRGAFLHDIGKMATPHRILTKPGKLTDDEMAIMREHPYRGYKMIDGISHLAEAAEIVYSHHERYDGQAILGG
jgi:putative nucleotidyltransferase with HDIG domain